MFNLNPKETYPNEKPSTTTKILQIRTLQLSGHFPKLSILRATTRIKNPHPKDSNPPNGPVWKVAKYPLWRIEIWSWEQNLFHADRCQNPRDAKLGLKKQLPTKKGTDDRYSKNGKTNSILYCIFYQPIPFQRFFFLRLCRCNVWLQFLFYLFGCKSANMFMRVLSKNAWGMTDVVGACPCDLFPRVPMHQRRSSTNGVYPRIGEMLCLTRMKKPWRYWYDSATKSDKDGWA